MARCRSAVLRTGRILTLHPWEVTVGKPARALGELSWHRIDSLFRVSVRKPAYTCVKCRGRGAMALPDDKNLAAEAAKRARFRVHHVGTKLNEAELHELEALAAKRKETQAELIRGLILHELARDAEGLRPSAEMTEITACRLLLTYLLRPVATGQPMTDKAFDEVVEEVKKHKARVARDRLKD